MKIDEKETYYLLECELFTFSEMEIMKSTHGYENFHPVHVLTEERYLELIEKEERLDDILIDQREDEMRRNRK